ncbi:twin-arginine translocation signal domain-containing protein [Streptomyces niveus]
MTDTSNGSVEPLGRRGFLGTLAAGAAVLGLPSLAEAANPASSPTRCPRGATAAGPSTYGSAASPVSR